MTWNTKSFDEIMRFENGKAIELTDGSGFPVYGSNGMIGNAKSHNHENAVILGRVGAYCGSVEYCSDKFWATDNTIVVYPQQGNSIIFLYYMLLNERLNRHAGGAAQPLLTQRILKPLSSSVCDFESQRRISFTLSTYDDLIAANQRRIQLLEEAARLLYSEWFVKLRFPGHETVPITDGVPEGWERRSVASLCSFLNRGITPQYNDAAEGLVINQKCIRAGRLSMEQARRQSKEVKPERLVQIGDILINSTGAGTLGRVALVMKMILECTVDTHVTIARPTDMIEQAFFGLALLNLEPVFSDMGKGSTNQLELSRNDIGNIDILVPRAEVRKDFHRVAWPLLEQAQQVADSNELLKEARDMLLPKLMSGALDVSRIAVPGEAAA